MNIVSLGHNRLDFVVRQMRSGHELLTKGGADWVEGTLILAAALREARDNHPADISFSAWLKQNDCAFFNADDRAALINLAADAALARVILEGSESRSYQLIWRTNAARFRSTTKPAARTATGRKVRTIIPGRKALHLAMKLGAETMQRIQGTSLDNHDEKEELVRLNRGAPLGELNVLVARLVDDAAAGKDVSAIAYASNRSRSPYADTPGVTPLKPSARIRGLLPAWRKRMVAAWQIADFAERRDLLDYLIASLPRDQQSALVEHLVDNLHPTTAPPPTGGSDGK